MKFVNKIEWVQVYLALEAAERRIPLNGSEEVRIGARSFCMTRTPDGIFALGPKCPHQGFRLAGGKCEDGMLVCPLHRFAFDVKTGKGHGMHLDTFPVEIREDGVYVGVEKTVWEW
ncbi:MAG: Rieske 2Fe-2S domain-containing protein [Flavobacteriales bacterium]|nr:Rieske 2Fe-2S domain-containing protein [Flavobacteriales bacterium]